MGWAPGRGRILGAGPTASWLKEEEEGLLLRLRRALTAWTVNTQLLAQDGIVVTAGKTSDPLQPPHVLRGPLPSAHRGPRPLRGFQVLPLNLLKLSPQGRDGPLGLAPAAGLGVTPCPPCLPAPSSSLGLCLLCEPRHPPCIIPSVSHSQTRPPSIPFRPGGEEAH